VYADGYPDLLSRELLTEAGLLVESI
jgi:hypothetical protein